MSHMLQFNKAGEKMHKDYLKNFQITFYQDLISIISKRKLPNNIKNYEVGQVIASINQQCEKVGIVLKGNVHIEHILEEGKKIIINQLIKYDIFGEILLFSNEPFYPYQIVSTTTSQVLFINKATLLKTFKEDINLLEKYLFHIAESYMNLNKYIKLKSQKTIVNKLAFYFINYANINSSQLICKLKSKTYLASFLGIERQSLVRELNNLKNKKLIDYDRKNIYIKDFSYFNQLIE